MSIVNTRASGQTAVSMWTSTDSSFWKEQAIVSRGWNRSTAYAMTSSAEARLEFVGAGGGHLDRALAFAALTTSNGAFLVQSMK